ncbi:MAG: hypothetical protein WBP56_20855 [Polyangia bacterium]
MDEKPSQACHGAFLAVDVVSFNSPKRTDQDLTNIRGLLQEYVEKALGDLPFEREHCSDGGDAVLAIARSDADKKALFLDVIPKLERQLRRHNNDLDDRLKIQLRVAIHFGEYTKDHLAITNEGVSGREINKTFRLLDSKLLRRGISQPPKEQPLVALVSDEFYQQVLLRQAPELLTNLRLCIVETKEGNQLAAWAFGFIPPVRTVSGTHNGKGGVRKKSTALRSSSAKGNQHILKDFMGQMDAIWEEHFDAAWDAIHTVDYTTERTVNQKLDIFFQQYHGVFFALVTRGARGRKLRDLCTKATATAWDLASSTWELVANARMGEAHRNQRTGHGTRHLLDAADAANRQGLAAPTPEERCARFKDAVDIVSRYVQDIKES